MKKRAILLIFLIVFLVMPFASASIFDWIAEITGRATAEEIESTAVKTESTIIKEQVKCTFLNSNTEQKCYSSDGNFGCSGTESCLVGVSGEKSKTLTWKSTCGSEAYTTIDGSDEYAEFKCEQVAVQAQTTTETPVQEVKEQVKCTFLNSNTEQKCYTSDGKFVCSGTGSCLADVYGAMGTKLEWKSTCGGYANTLIDGNSEYAEFKCETAPTNTIPVPTATAAEVIKEQVRCIFSNSNSEQKCYGGEFACSGIGSCIAEVSGQKGTMLAWKSTCGGYAYTVIDGNNEYAEFKCEQIATTTPVSAEIIKEQVKCVFVNSVSTQECYGGGGACKGTGTCVVDVVGEKGTMLTWKSSCGGYAYTVIDGNNDYAEFKCEQTTPIIIDTCKDSDGFDYFLKGYVEVDHGTFTSKDFDTCRVINSNTDYYDTAECSGANCYVLESLCAEHGTFQSRAWKCLNECKDGACIKAEVREQVRCIFSDPELIQRCYADMGKLGCENIARKCYTDDGKFECSEITLASTPVEGGGFMYTPFCIAEVSGYLGTKLTWKSSCGGYAYTVIDGNHEDAGFDCVPSSNVTSEQISGKGFSHAYWQCYDGTEEKSIEGVELTTCKSSEIWQEYAEKFCENRCNKEGTKCGVNSFSVSGECYIDVAKEGVFISSFREEKKTEEIKKAELEKAEEKIKPMLICKDSCPLDEKCYPFGYRKAGKFCFDEGAFKEQLKDNAVCENNFECSTNVCVDGKCISSGVINKVLSWFKKLFGAG